MQLLCNYKHACIYRYKRISTNNQLFVGINATSLLATQIPTAHTQSNKFLCMHIKKTFTVFNKSAEVFPNKFLIIQGILWLEFIHTQSHDHTPTLHKDMGISLSILPTHGILQFSIQGGMYVTLYGLYMISSSLAFCLHLYE